MLLAQNGRTPFLGTGLVGSSAVLRDDYLISVRDLNFVPIPADHVNEGKHCCCTA
jgi:hypothetical protein